MELLHNHLVGGVNVIRLTVCMESQDNHVVLAQFFTVGGIEGADVLHAAVPTTVGILEVVGDVTSNSTLSILGGCVDPICTISLAPSA